MSYSSFVEFLVVEANPHPSWSAWRVLGPTSRILSGRSCLHSSRLAREEGVTSACESLERKPVPSSGAQDGCSTMPAPGAPIGAAFLAWEHSQERSSYCGPTLLLMCLPIMVTCLSGRPKLLHNIPLIVIADLFRLFPYLTLGLSLGLSSGV